MADYVNDLPATLDCPTRPRPQHAARSTFAHVPRKQQSRRTRVRAAALFRVTAVKPSSVVEAVGIGPHGVGGRVGIVGNVGGSGQGGRGPKSPAIPPASAAVPVVVTRVTAASLGDPLVLALEQARREHIANALRAVREDDGDE